MLVVGAVLAASGGAAAAKPMAPDFGPNVLVFDPGMAVSKIKAEVDAIASQQLSNEFGPQRYALLFKPGTCGSAAAPLNFQVGYHAAVAGLGRSPTDVVINGSVNVYNRCRDGTCFALDPERDQRHGRTVDDRESECPGHGTELPGGDPVDSPGVWRPCGTPFGWPRAGRLRSRGRAGAAPTLPVASGAGRGALTSSRWLQYDYPGRKARRAVQSSERPLAPSSTKLLMLREQAWR
jgi:hypothetical protein